MRLEKIMVSTGTVALCLFGLVACSNQIRESASPLDAVQSHKQEMTLATGGVAGTYYSLGAEIAYLLTEKMGNVVVTPQSTGASIANLTLLKNREVDLVLAASNSAQRAYEGSDPFTEPFRELRAIASLYPEAFHFITKRNRNIQSISNINGLRVSVGPKLGGTARSTQEIIEAHGIDFNRDIKVEYLSFSEAVFALEADLIDVAVVASGIPTEIVSQIAEAIDIRLLQADSQMIQSLVKKQPYMFPYVIPANTYKGVTEDVLVVSSPALLVTTSDKDEEQIYALTKALFSKPEQLWKRHEQGKNIQLKHALEGISIPLHKGAVRFYLEKGLITDRDGHEIIQ